MQAIPCIFCNKFNTATALYENGFEGKQCATCNLIYISPRPNPQEISNLYGHDQAHIPAQNHIDQKYPKTLHALHTLNIIQKFLPKGDLLELGSGAGYFLTQAKKAGFNPHGIELNPVQAAFIQNQLHIPCLETSLATDSYGDKLFDVIYHSDVLSHFYDPIEAFNTMHAKLKPGGYLIFETGNIADIDAKYYPVFNAYQYPDHLFFFGQQSITQLLKITQFTYKNCYRYSILGQLRIMKAVTRLKNKHHNQGIKKSDNSKTSSTTLKKSLVLHAKKSYHKLMHTLRYTFGSYLPKERKPQTVIVVAQKK